MIEPKQINEFTWTIDKQGQMNVPAVIYTSEKLMEKVRGDKTFQQVMNVACLKGIVKHSIAMPDCHEGYGFPIGGVAAFDMDEGIISPGGIGYDINCSVRLLKTDFNANEILKHRTELLNELFKNVPVGTGRKGIINFSKDQVLSSMSKGAKYMIDEAYGKSIDIDRTEENGYLDADPALISDKALLRGLPQLGTLGSGNHFLEIQKVDKIYDEKVAKAFGRFLEDPDTGLSKGPWVQLRRPFRPAPEGAPIPFEIALPFHPFRHQWRAWMRLIRSNVLSWIFVDYGQRQNNGNR